jgi:hypothetical protein
VVDGTATRKLSKARTFKKSRKETIKERFEVREKKIYRLNKNKGKNEHIRHIVAK